MTVCSIAGTLCRTDSLLGWLKVCAAVTGPVRPFRSWAILALSVSGAQAARYTPLWSLPLRLTDLPSDFQLTSSKGVAGVCETVFHYPVLAGTTDIDDIVRRSASSWCR